MWVRAYLILRFHKFIQNQQVIPRGPCDDTKQCAILLGLQVQSVVARVNFLHKGTRGLCQTLGEQSKKLSSFSSGNLQNNLLILRPQLHRVVVKHKM
jgi:hypothetical protein